jgi:RNA polymerase sigma factor (sigma-70 family)
LAAVPSSGRASEVERGAAPEADATRALYERYSGQLYGFCLHRLGSREEAEDAVQTTFLNAFRGLRRGIVPEAESAWLFKIAENVCLTRHRSTRRRGRVESPSDMQALQDVTPARATDGGDELIPLGDALAAMPETQRRAILLREWQGLSYKEIAGEMGVSQSAVETLIFRARRSLANALETPWRERRAAGQAGRHAFDLGSLLAGLKTLFAGGAAAKVAAVAAVAVTGTALAVGDSRQPTAPQRIEPSIAAARAPDSVAPRPAVSPLQGTAKPALGPAPKPERTWAARPKETKRSGGAAAPEATLDSATDPAVAGRSRARETPPGLAKEPGTPASPRSRASRAQPEAKPKLKPKAKPKQSKPKSKPAPEAKPKPEQAKPAASPPPPASPAAENTPKEKEKGE